MIDEAKMRPRVGELAQISLSDINFCFIPGAGNSVDEVFNQQRPESFMAGGYMVYQSIVYISQYLPKLEAPTMNALDRIWYVNSIKTFEGEHLLGKGRMEKVRGN
jgi:hypothetical protein